MDRLRAQNGLTLSELGESLKMSRQALAKHLALLEAANLVVSMKRVKSRTS